jgi:uncharacterized GH25 family protein
MKEYAGYRYLCLVAWACLFPVVSAAHEFWIEPVDFFVPEDGHIVANLKVGQFFKGSPQAFIPERFIEFSVMDSSGKRAVNGRLGDLPALREPARRPGTYVLSYRSRAQSATYETFAKFERFARREGNPWLIEAHKQRGLSRRNVREAYTRYAKSLVRVGDAPGGDVIVGFPLELVLEADPYRGAAGVDIPVALLWRGNGMPRAQISVFRKSQGCDAAREFVLTDENGRARVGVGDGGRFLLNAVHVIEPRPETLRDIDAQWESLWASTTFEVPQSADSVTTRAECPSPEDTLEK